MFLYKERQTVAPVDLEEVLGHKDQGLHDPSGSYIKLMVCNNALKV